MSRYGTDPNQLSRMIVACMVACRDADIEQLDRLVGDHSTQEMGELFFHSLGLLSGLLDKLQKDRTDWMQSLLRDRS